MPGITLDTTNCHLIRQHGDIIAAYTWLNDERSLVLIPYRRKGAPFFIVPESRAFEYEDPQQLARSAHMACEVMGMEASRPNWYRIAKIIDEGLPDLIRMPHAKPKEEAKGPNIGEAHLMADGQILHSDLITEEKQGMTYGD